MKKLPLCLIVFFLLCSKVYSQPFGANNAVWHYNFCTVWNNPNWCEPFTIDVPSSYVANGITYYNFQLNNSNNCSPHNTYTIYESNDSVYYWLPGSNRYSLLYNWNALPGDTETIYVDGFSGIDSVMLRIDSVSVININGFNKKIFYPHFFGPIPTQFTFGGPYIEDIGSSIFLFPQYSGCDPLTIGIRCYEDTIIGLYQPWMPGTNCEATLYVGIEDLNSELKISVQPNPVADFITVSQNFSLQKNFNVSLYNLCGKLLTSSDVVGKQEIKISLKDFPAGTYFVKISIAGNETFRKIVKM